MKALFALALVLCALPSLAQQQTAEQQEAKTNTAAVTDAAGADDLSTSSRFRIRQNDSIPSYAQPVVFIDGKKQDYEALTKVNPNDIQSIMVKKGKGAASADGDKEADGVVYVTMKKKN